MSAMVSAGPSTLPEIEPTTMTPKTEEIDELLHDDSGESEVYFEEEDEDDPNAFRVRGALKQHTIRYLTTLELHELIHSGGVDLEPSYQRARAEVVWPETKKIGLIDSIFRNFYIPPVVFAVIRDDDGEESRVCVDGKQRLTSIIPHKDPVTKKAWWYTTPDSSKGVRSEIPKIHKEWFAGRTLTVVEYDYLTASEEREIFQRVQLGMPLTAAEKLQAFASPWAEWITQLEARHVAVEGGLSTKLSWDTKRSRDFQNLAHMVFCCDGLPDEMLPTSQKIEKWIARCDKPSGQFQNDIENVLRTLWVVATNDAYNEGFVNIDKRIAPVEFIFIGVLLYVLRDEDRAVQGRAIYLLRKRVRQEFRDIRNNGDVGKAMWRNIRRLQEQPPAGPFEGRTSPKNNKRKRNNDDDDEFHPTPIKSLGKAVKTRSKQAKAS
ncbi:hypothetical protein NLJ89_g9457 [Agrocybe chaxingu]|uniref:GmrSD restriction endonucleases N-terminal domain-containing protein n=1 Tax=Agrocybe chaxingu TaxID=84603 RepID=A0A9W8K0J6_9AGAR|nr:hypothetical protein NLJ89_g9457 [Agrocybe chaxingu]